ncbi:MAG: leucine-rich repeat domain-containing protein, partial [Mycoplasma sp.]
LIVLKLSLICVEEDSQLTKIGDYAFFKCNALETLEFLNSLTTIGDSSFEYCPLKTIAFPESLKTIGDSSFSYCKSLTSVSFPQNSQLTLIKNYAFYFCDKLETINIPNSLETISDSVFSGCKILKTITFTENSQLKSMGVSTFRNCVELTGDLIIPRTTTSIGKNSFENCSKLNSITVSNELYKDHKTTWSQGYNGEVINTDVLIDGMFTLSPEGKLSITDGWINTEEGIEWAKTGELVIPKEIKSFPVKEIVSGDSNKNFTTSIKDKIKSLSFEDGNQLEKIGDNAFQGCSNLTGNLDLSNLTNLTTIGNYVFQLCEKLNGELILTNLNNLTTIGISAFHYSSNLTGKLNLSTLSNLKTIGSDAFGSCEKITSIIVSSVLFKNHNTTWSQGYWDGVFGSKSNVIDVDAEVLPMFQITDDGVLSITDGWINTDDGKEWIKTSDLVIPATVDGKPVKEIVGGTESNNFSTQIKNLVRTLTFEEGSQITKIGDSAFYNCTYLDGDFTLPNTLTTIGNRAFQNLQYTNNLTLPSSVTSIGEYAFGWSKFTGDLDLSLLSNLTSIGKDAFYSCKFSSITVSNDLYQSHNSVWSQGYWNKQTGSTSNVINADVQVLPMFQITDEGVLFLTDGWLDTIAGEDWVKTGELTIPATVGGKPVKEIGEKFGVPIETTLKKLSFEEGNQITKIGNNAFDGCENLTGDLDLSSLTSLITIGNLAFRDCTGLTGTLNLSGLINLTTIGDTAFYQCSKLTGDLNLSGLTKLEMIGDFAFSNCIGLTGTLNLSGLTKLEMIGDFAFSNCIGLTGTLNLSGLTNLTTIGRNAFNNCSGLKGNLNLSNSKKLQIIDENAFYNCSSLNGELNLTGLTNLQTIGYLAFYKCSNLTGALDLSSSTQLTKIGNNTFDSCNNIPSIKVKKALYDSRFEWNQNYKGTIINAG